MAQTIAVLDFGSQLTQVIARRIRECEVYSKIYHYSTPAAKLREDGVVGIILSGGPQSVYANTAPHPDAEIFKLGVPVLGICYGVQLMGHFLGGKVELSKAREYGHGHLTIKKPGKLFANSSPVFRASCASGIRTATNSSSCRPASSPSARRTIRRSPPSRIESAVSTAFSFTRKFSTPSAAWT
jgi:GMP synthase-like glutamine amidotransferase